MAVGVLVFVASTFCIGALYLQARDAQVMAVRNKLERFAREGAALVNVRIHETLRSPEQKDSPEYALARQPLVVFHESFPELGCVYTTIKDGNQFRYVLTTENHPIERAAGLPATPSQLMQAHMLKDPDLAAVFEDPSVRSSPGPIKGKLGTFMSGFAPICDNSGRVVGVFAIDVDPKKFAAGLGSIHRATGTSVIVAFLISLCVGVAIRFFRLSTLEKTVLWQQAEAGKLEAEEARSAVVETLQRNVRLLHAAAEVNALLLKRRDFSQVLPQALAILGEASRADRAYFVATLRDANTGRLIIDEKFHWERPLESEDDVVSFDFYSIGMSDWLSKLQDGQVINAVTDHLPETHQAILKKRNVRSIVLTPVTVRDSFAGFVGFEDVQLATQWTDEETAILRSLASNLGWSLLRSHTEMEKEESRSLLNGILDSSIDAIVALRAIRTISGDLEDFEIILTNATAQRMLGARPEKLVGARFLSVNPGGSDDGLLEIFANVAETGETASIEKHYQNENPPKWMHIVATQLGDGVAVTFSDISAQKNVEMDHLRAKEGAEAADRAKSEFLAVMSHEIRTPMNGVIGFTTLLQDTNLDEAQREFVETIRRSGESLVALINDILDFSKIEAGKVDLEAAPVHVRDTLDNVIYINRHAASVKGLEMSVGIEPGVPDFIVSDGARLQQILINLTANAVKFTTEGSVRLAARLAGIESMDGAPMLRVGFSVSDTGIGLETEKIPRLFKPFSQADSSTTRRFGGTGLGLAICKKLSNLLGGDIWVESDGETGSTFHFTILAGVFELPARAAPAGQTPFAQAAPPPVGIVPPPAETPQSLPESSGESLSIAPFPLRLLVAEDNPVNQRIIKLLLKKFGFEPDIADDGREALELWENNCYDLIFMDVQMPNLDGYAATKEIRSREKAGTGRPRVHICALTADAMERDRERCLLAGMDDYLSKPINPEKIAEMIESVWTRTNTSVADSPQKQWSPAASSISRVASQRSLTEDPRYMG